ncbi:MAG: hypothetical protein JRG96_08960 [Deltaproteobacteria bacterium]|nr:hypothetical protein [Deltaproteobacteria bacterium]MBW2421081.1 hypothetical protein [Deltaproteobacteria bacterium]
MANRKDRNATDPISATDPINATDPASSVGDAAGRDRKTAADRSFAHLVSRRELLLGAAAGFGALAFPARIMAAEAAFELPEVTRAALSGSPLVYVSPLHPDGKESRCHGEVWYFVDGKDVVIVTGAERWKAEAVRSGRDRARIWVGDFGRGKKVGDRYRAGPTFVTRASIDKDPAAFRRLMKAFAGRYPDEWGKWEPRFEKGHADGTRVLIRYSPIAG